MLKFIKHTMETINGIEVFPIISFLIFFFFFIVLFIWVAKLKKSEIATIAALPIEKENNQQKTNS